MILSHDGQLEEELKLAFFSLLSTRQNHKVVDTHTYAHTRSLKVMRKRVKMLVFGVGGPRGMHVFMCASGREELYR